MDLLSVLESLCGTVLSCSVSPGCSCTLTVVTLPYLTVLSLIYQTLQMRTCAGVVTPLQMIIWFSKVCLDGIYLPPRAMLGHHCGPYLHYIAVKLIQTFTQKNSQGHSFWEHDLWHILLYPNHSLKVHKIDPQDYVVKSPLFSNEINVYKSSKTFFLKSVFCFLYF